MMDRLSVLNTFVQVAESGSFTSAGQRLGISASAVGKAIGRLEERLDVRLFHRSTRAMTLTAEGDTLLGRCRRIFAEIEAAEADIAHSSATVAGPLRVGLPLTGMLLMPVVSAFALAHPAVRLDLDFSDRLVGVIEEGFDVVLRTGAPADSELLTRRVGSYSYAIVAAPSYLVRAGTPLVPEDLLGHACLHHRWSATGKLEGWRLKSGGEPLDIDLPVSAVSSTIEPLIELAERGVGVTSLPIFAVRRQLAAGTLVSLLDRHLDDVGTFRLMWPAGRQMLPRVRSFIDFVSEHLFADPPAT